MPSSFQYVAGLAVLASLAHAKVNQLPLATTTFNFPPGMLSPRPTKAPVYGDLRKRQSSDTTVLVAPDNTCGYISGRAGAVYTCGGSGTCAFFTAVNRNNPGQVVCCGSKSCESPRTCFDSREVSSSSLCDGGCLLDVNTLKCTGTGRPYCGTVSFSESIFGYWCASNENSTPQAATTTYAGQDSRAWSQLILTDDPTSSSASRLIRTTVTTASDQETSTAPAPGPDPGPDKPSSTPIGAIVGGVVGGVAVIALVIFGIWFLIRKKKHNGPQGQQQQQQQQQQPPADLQPQMSYAQPPQGSPSQYAATTHTQSVYDPKFGGPNGYPQSFGGTPPPPPQGEYQQPYFATGNMAPDRTDTTSPGAVSQMTHSNSNNNNNNRFSMQPVSPHTVQGGFQQFGQQPPPQHQLQQQQQPPPTTIHEAPTTADGHRGHMHELA